MQLQICHTWSSTCARRLPVLCTAHLEFFLTSHCTCLLCAELSSMMAKAWEALDEAERDEHIKKVRAMHAHNTTRPHECVQPLCNSCLCSSGASTAWRGSAALRMFRLCPGARRQRRRLRLLQHRRWDKTDPECHFTSFALYCASFRAESMQCVGSWAMCARCNNAGSLTWAVAVAGNEGQVRQER